MTTLLVLISVIASLIASAILLDDYVLEREHRAVQNKIKNVARMVAKDTRVIDKVEGSPSDAAIQNYANEVMNATGVSFVVVLDNDLTRKSHPDESVIGGTFSNIDDASRSLNGTEHYSRHVGILGEGTRFFTPIWNDEGEQIGIVCVGYVQQTINDELWNARKNLYVGLGVGLLVGIIGALYLARYLKKVLLGLEPKQIVAHMKEKEIIIDSVSEAIIAVSPKRKVLLQNVNFNKLLNKTEVATKAISNGYLNDTLFSLIFDDVFKTEKPIANRVTVINHFEFIVNVQLIYIDKNIYGAVATLYDQSELQHLIRELSGTEQYIDSLRAQNHKFMNQLHTILGLIELEKYEDVHHFVRVLNHNYHREMGFVTDKIKSSAIAGFLLGKTSELDEQGVTLIIDEDSYFPAIKIGDMLHDLLLSMGILIDNAKEAVINSSKKQVILFLKYDEAEEVIMFEVQDTGPGIEKHVLPKIFERGYSTKGENRGYGLDAIQSIVKQYHGLVDVQAKTGRGSTFRIEFPFKWRNKNDESNDR
ncbi:ATP-binding protein [Virgibacillus dokdonensis]|uniref:histidine kinase n=1 Tax=Virgibacillus dokdonensis TaxID=302167 RepID=A0A2K9J459_9BACI|nr:sensor histidine kinase [Virgibacillus dokdonensis]AUJ25823.1 Sensor histidine kinase DcuS [Virgibacillus dokdonensis]